MKAISYEKLFLSLLIGAALIVLIKTNILTTPLFQQYMDIARAFLHHQLHFLPDARTVYDSVLFEGKYYWPLGLVPILILMPFVALFGLSVHLGYIHVIFVLLSTYLLYKIADKILGNRIGAVWLSFGYVFASAFIGLVWFPSSWQFAQVTGSFFVIASLYEYFYKKRWWLIGVYVALAFAARMDLILAVVFFVGNILFAYSSREKMKHLVMFFIPVGISIIILLLYNYVRFHDFFEQGYVLQMLTVPELIANKHAGTWSFVHVLTNLYYFFFKGPDPVFIPGSQMLTFPYIHANDWGMSVFFTSPLFLWIIRAPFKKKEVMLAVITTALLAFAVFGYYGIGYIQFGCRYACDFYPFLFIILLYALRKHVSTLLKVIITLTFIFNVYLLTHK